MAEVIPQIQVTDSPKGAPSPSISPAPASIGANDATDSTGQAAEGTWIAQLFERIDCRFSHLGLQFSIEQAIAKTVNLEADARPSSYRDAYL